MKHLYFISGKYKLGEWKKTHTLKKVCLCIYMAHNSEIERKNDNEKKKILEISSHVNAHHLVEKRRNKNERREKR